MTPVSVAQQTGVGARREHEDAQSIWNGYPRCLTGAHAPGGAACSGQQRARQTEGRAMHASGLAERHMLPVCYIRRSETSLSCAMLTELGAALIRSEPELVLGNAMTSRMESQPASSMHTRSRPSAKPPMGGAP